jgi:hypothetical protein
MALPAHLTKYDSLIDLLVEQLVREIEGGFVEEKPAASWQTLPRVGDFRRDDSNTFRAP